MNHVRLARLKPARRRYNTYLALLEDPFPAITLGTKSSVSDLGRWGVLVLVGARTSRPVPCSATTTSNENAGDPVDGNTKNTLQTAVHNSPHGQLPNDEERTRASLFTVGVLLLELIFGHALEDCRFRRAYCGSDGQPNEQTDACTARRWAQGLLGESGADVADAVRRCLDCSFGPRPDLGDGRFRGEVYEGVVRPLAEYGGVWPAVVA